MALSQLLCTLALAAILSPKGRTEKRNFRTNERRMSGKMIIYHLTLFVLIASFVFFMA